MSFHIALDIQMQSNNRAIVDLFFFLCFFVIEPTHGISSPM